MTEPAAQTATKVLLVRHGQSVANAGGRTSDHDSNPLTDLGRAQARDFANRLPCVPTLFVVSPFLRTQQTAEPLRQRFPEVPVEEWPIQEFTFLEPANHKDTTEEDRQPQVTSYWQRQDPAFIDGPGAESFMQFLDRARETAHRLVTRNPGGCIVIFTHGYFMQAFRLVARFPNATNAKLMANFLRFHLVNFIQNTDSLEFTIQDGKIQPVGQPRLAGFTHYKERHRMLRLTTSVIGTLALTVAASALPLSLFAQSGTTITGKAAFTDYTQEHPGVRRKITLADLPEPNPDESVDNGPSVVPRPEGAWPIAPKGFKVEMYAQGFREPRLMRTAPNGDIFLADSHGDKIWVLRGVGPDGKAQTVSTFADGLNLPFGIAFYPSNDPKWIYVGNTDSVVRIPYKSGDLVATGKPEKIVPQLPGFAQLRGGGHWTRDIVFTPDGKNMLVSVGSASNADDPDTHPNEFHRADVLEFTPEGKFVKVYAYGIRNCVGEAINPTTGQLWCSTNERDRLGDNLVPDYITSVKEGGFYGWPWYYMGGHQDPRLMGTHPELKDKVITPDVILQPHFASLEMVFYTGKQFPSSYDGDAFAAEHGSWNRAHRSGYEVIRVPMHDGHATGEYEDFLTGFVTPDGKVWGRPVGVTLGKDGSLFVTDDGTKTVWHVIYTGK